MGDHLNPVEITCHLIWYLRPSLRRSNAYCLFSVAVGQEGGVFSSESVCFTSKKTWVKENLGEVLVRGRERVTRVSGKIAKLIGMKEKTHHEAEVG